MAAPLVILIQVTRGHTILVFLKSVVTTRWNSEEGHLHFKTRIRWGQNPCPYSLPFPILVLCPFGL
jgi:hypothetical protein